MLSTLIATDALCANLQDDNLLLFDCRFDLTDVDRGEQDYGCSHIPGAIYAHLDRHLSSRITEQSGRHPMPDIQMLVGWLASCGLTEDSQVVVYDDCGGAMAARLWWLLKCLGHDAVALLDGGWQAWLAAGYAVDANLPETSASLYHGEFNKHCVVTTEAVLSNLRTAHFALIDVRADFRFRGENEPIDPVAGHIPGAWNIPLTENLNADGLFKQRDELQGLYADLLAQFPPEQQVYMCGSGVTACHSVLAMEVITGQRPRVYAGSWSEWIRDPERPVACAE